MQTIRYKIDCLFRFFSKHFFLINLNFQALAHVSFSDFNQNDTSHHLEIKSFCTVHPREGRFQDLIFLKMFSNFKKLENFLISLTRFFTNIPQGQSVFINFKAVESIQKYVSRFKKFKIFRNSVRRIPMQQTNSSNIGIETLFSGAILDLNICSCTTISLFS